MLFKLIKNERNIYNDGHRKGLKIPKEYLESVSMRTTNAMAIKDKH